MTISQIQRVCFCKTHGPNVFILKSEWSYYQYCDIHAMLKKEHFYKVIEPRFWAEIRHILRTNRCPCCLILFKHFILTHLFSVLLSTPEFSLVERFYCNI